MPVTIFPPLPFMVIGDEITDATEGSVLFVGSLGVLAQDNANLFWDDSTNMLGIGISNPEAKLHVVNTDGPTAGIFDNYSNNLAYTNSLFGRKFSGTLLAPRRTKSGAAIVRLGAGGGYAPDDVTVATPVSAFRARIELSAVEDWTTTAQGTKITFATTLAGTKIRTERLVIEDSGNIGIGTLTPKSKLEIAGPISTAISTKLADYTITEDDSMVLLDGTANTVTATLPTAVGITGREYSIKCIDDTFTTDFATNGAEEVDGSSVNIGLINMEVITVKSDGANWWIK